MSIDIRALRKFDDNKSVLTVAYPVLAYECEVFEPRDDGLDAYEEAVLKLVSIGMSANGAAKCLNLSESLSQHLLFQLDSKGYVKKPPFKQWELTEDGKSYLEGKETETNVSTGQFGYMFVDAIKKDTLQYFYKGDIAMIRLADADTVNCKLTLEDDERATFKSKRPRSWVFRQAYERYSDNSELLQQLERGEISQEEALDLYAEYEAFDEISDYENDEGVEREQVELSKDNIICSVRLLNRPPQRLYLEMRIIISPEVPFGYKVESPLDFNGLDDYFFEQQIKWMCLSDDVYYKGEPLKKVIQSEVLKVCNFDNSNKPDKTVEILRRFPALNKYKDKYKGMYDNLGAIFTSMHEKPSLIDKENAINNISRQVVEPLFKKMLAVADKNLFAGIKDSAISFLNTYGEEVFKEKVFALVGLNVDDLHINSRNYRAAINKLDTTGGNSILEKFMNVVTVRYFTGERYGSINRFLFDAELTEYYKLLVKLNQIRIKVTHDAEERITAKDYDFYIDNVFKAAARILNALEEN